MNFVSPFSKSRDPFEFLSFHWNEFIFLKKIAPHTFRFAFFALHINQRQKRACAHTHTQRNKSAVDGINLDLINCDQLSWLYTKSKYCNRMMFWQANKKRSDGKKVRVEMKMNVDIVDEWYCIKCLITIQIEWWLQKSSGRLTNASTHTRNTHKFALYCKWRDYYWNKFIERVNNSNLTCKNDERRQMEMK